MQKYYPGALVEGSVVAIKSYGAFLQFDDDVSGLLHISEITDAFVSDINQYLQVGEKIKVKVLDVDEETGHLKLSLKAVKRNYYRKKRNLSEEHFNAEKEFRILKEQLPKFMKDTLERIG